MASLEALNANEIGIFGLKCRARTKRNESVRIYSDGKAVILINARAPDSI
jgi:hypothetical protein